MVDREKVLVGLESCADRTGALCRTCPYDFVHNENCMGDMAQDALELLKEQEPKLVLYRDDGEYCPQCSTINTRAMGVQRLHRGTRYCPYCGQAVKWE